MYKIKARPEDFLVDEILDYSCSKTGKHLLCILKKRKCNTMSAISKIAKSLRIKEKEIGYCGNKDYNAVTSQYISIPSKFKNLIANIDLTQDGISIDYICNIDEKLHLGDLSGNKFRITLRNLDKIEIELDKKIRKVPNLFGEQRFSQNNIEYGRLLVNKKFDILCEKLSVEKDGSLLKEHLENNRNDYVGALKKYPRNLLFLYIHAYQSFLWNEVAKKIIKNYPDTRQQSLPILGFGSELEGVKKDYYSEIMQQESITQRDFINKKIPELSSDGSQRELFMVVDNFSYEIKKDELFDKKTKVELVFTLGKGSYATTLIKHLFAQE